MPESTRPRKERTKNADKRRNQILEATCRSIVKNGLFRTTLSAVAKETGMSEGTAVFYFKSKNGLLSAALRRHYETYEAHWQQALSSAGDDPTEQLVAVIRACFDPVVCNSETLAIWFAFWGEQKFTPQYAAITHEFDLRWSAAILGFCTRLLPEDPEKAKHLAEWIDTLTDGYWQQLHLYGEEMDTKTAFAGTIRFLCAQLPDHAADIEACTASRRF